MPMYVYEVLDEHGDVCDVFEIIQKITEPPLTKHPETGQTVRMSITAPFVAKKTHGELPKADLSDRNLEKLGFTKYKKKRGGGYDKVVGDGPAIDG
jgi:hypothetical protein